MGWRMTPDDIRKGATYSDGATAIRTVDDIIETSDGGPRTTVVYREHAGLNRGRVNTLPIETFAAFATETVAPERIAAARRALGLAAYPVDQRTRDLIQDAVDGVVTPRGEEDAQRMEKLVGLGLATRAGPRLRAETYRVETRLLRASKTISRIR